MSNWLAHKDEATPPSHGVAKGFIFLAAFLTSFGWMLSACGKLAWIAGLFWVGLAVAIWIARRQCGGGRQLAGELAAPFRSRLILLLTGCMLAAACCYTPAGLDSLTYRLPRILFWLEQGRVYHIASAEPRLNYLGQGWELCTAPVVALAGVRFAWAWSFLSWVVCLDVFYRWGLRLGQSPNRSRAFALLANTSSFAVLQASNTSNDLLPATFLLLTVDFIWAYETHRRPGDIHWVGVSLALCTGVKPHFAVMGPMFLLWFFLARSQPWRSYTWRFLPATVPVMLLCSCAMTFAFNYQHYGRITGPDQRVTFQRMGPVQNVFFGTLMMGWQAFQPSVNPAALVLEATLEKAVVDSGIRDRAPVFALGMYPVCMVDYASMGLFSAGLMAWGWWLGLFREGGGVNRFSFWAWLAGLAGFAAAVSQFLPGSVGRSFLAFWLLGLILAMEGWRHFAERTLRIATLVAGITALVVLVLNPARPLWPARAVRQLVSGRVPAAVTNALDTYLRVRNRSEAGRALADLVPDSEPFYVALIAEDRPLLPVLTSRHGVAGTRLLHREATVAELQALGPRYVLIGDPRKEDYAELSEFLANSRQYQVIATKEYVSRLSRGAGTWTLYAPKPGPPD